MSLFPAYAKPEINETSAKVQGSEKSLLPAVAVNESAHNASQFHDATSDSDWLTCTSFSVREESKQSSNGASSVSEKIPSKKKKKKHKHKSKKKKDVSDQCFQKAHERMVEILSDNSSFYVDRKGSKNNLLIPTLMKNDAALYKKPRRGFQFNPETHAETKKKLKWRYFNCSSKTFEHNRKVLDYLPSQTNENIIPLSSSDTPPNSQNTEMRIAETTASYNQQLAEDPHNEELWLEFVQYQDQVLAFEKRYRSSNCESSLVTAERKLSILDKALSRNPLSETLLYCKFDILSKTHNLDKLSEEIFSALRQDFGNINLWNRYIMITQCTVSRFTVPKVTSLYTQAMEKVSFMQKYGILTTELHLLELFTRCALFLRQSGLWEQLCMLIRLNLQLNLSSSEIEDYKIEVKLPDKKIYELENGILACGLPISALWLRLEKIRQRVHWYPVSDADCEDPQRVVLPTDVTDFVRPIRSRSLTLRIIILTMYLLKVPLIPLRDTVFRSLSLNSISWHLDSGEILLSAFCSVGITQGRCKEYEESIISCLQDLVSYPQYVNDELGQLEYLEFLHNMFKKVFKHLPLNLETIVLVWWLRFERTLLIIDKQPPSRKKRLKSFFKDLLKEERHRNNLAVFIEYAFLEKELSQNTNSCTKILETALTMYPMKKNLFHYSSTKNYVTHLYRVLAEVHLAEDNKEKSLRLLTSLALSMPEKEIVLDSETLKVALSEFQRITDDILREDYFSNEFELDQLEPQFFVEWLYSQAWFLYLTESVQSSEAFLNEVLSKLRPYKEDKLITVDVYYRELLMESKVIILHFHCHFNKTGYHLLNETLQKGIEEFPNNMCLLSTLSDLETKLNFGSPWWKIDRCLRSNDSQVAKLILILLCRRRLIFYEKANLTSVKILYRGSCGSTSSGFSNRMKALLQKLTRDESTRLCPLIWTIYLQYCAQYERETKYRDVFYMAIESCPWVKALYMEIGHTFLDQVSQLQDLMIEKEMRIHITQDEIDILRET